MIQEIRAEAVKTAAQRLASALKEVEGTISNGQLRFPERPVPVFCIEFLAGLYAKQIGNIHLVVSDDADNEKSRELAFHIPRMGISVSIPTTTDGKYKPFPDVLQKTNELSRALGGNECEARFLLTEGEPKEPEYWVNWKKDHPKLESESVKIYDKAGELLLWLAPEKEVVVADIFGGDGSFLQQLSHPLAFKTKAGVEMHLYDRDCFSLFNAKDIFSQLGNHKVSTFVHEPVDLTRSERLFEGIKPPTIVTAIGGLNWKVVTKDDAVRVAIKVYEEMADDGVFIVTGCTPSLLNANEFTRIGFRVENMAVQGSIPDFDRPYQLYALRKVA